MKIKFYDWAEQGDFPGVPGANPGVPGGGNGVPAQVNPHAVRACLVALASGKLPTIRALRAALGVGQERARATQWWLKHLINNQ